MPSSQAIRNVRIFDGTHILPQSTVIVQESTITAVGNNIAIPSDTQVIDGNGQTLLPGLIDAHTHVYGPALKQALILGVTTELDMFMDHHTAVEIKQKQADGQGLDMSDLRSAGTAITAPGGHGTEYGLPIPTINGPDEAQEFVDARIAEGSDYIKIIYDDGKAFGRPIPTISKATMAAVVAAAHKRGKLAIVHITAYQDARDAIEVGADALAHLFFDKMPDSQFGNFVAAHRAFVIPTLTVLESAVGIPSGASLVTDMYLAPYLSPGDARILQNAFPPARSNEQRTYEAAKEAVRLLKAAGVPILAGTDASNPGTLHGASIHRELELLVQAGLTPTEALAATTSVPARLFSLDDRGRIAPGLRADLLLVRGDPTTDIKATRDIVSIWKLGVPVDREAYRSMIEQQKTEAQNRPAPVGSESGLVSDFEDGSLSTQFGSGWHVSTDNILGGTSTATMEVVPGGANGSKNSLLITGELVPGSVGFAWAGAIFFPGPAPFAPVNLSAKKAITFWAKGDGQAYRIMLYLGSLQSIPASVTFVAGSNWQQFSFPFSDFSGSDGRELLGVLFAAGTPGKFAFQLDNVSFQ
jgi:imidazolonepropionase-like amidohydrolase